MEAILKELKAAGKVAGMPNPMADVNISTHKEQAQQIWDMLDEMADKDPQAYAKFVRQQMENGKSERTGRKTIIPDVGICLQSVISGIDVREVPSVGPGGEVRCALSPDLKPTQRVYVNLVSHSAILPPFSHGSKTSPIDVEKSEGRACTLTTLLNLEIPLAISNPHSVRGTAKTEWAIDVLLHKWIIRKVDTMPDFFPHFIEFLLRSISEELAVRIDATSIVKLAEADYVGGLPKGSGGSTAGIIDKSVRSTEEPLAFDLGPINKTATGSGTTDSARPAAPDAPVRLGNPSTAPAKPLSSPTSLLQELRHKEMEKDGASLMMSAVCTTKRTSASFCEMIVSSNAKDISVSFIFSPEVIDVRRLCLDMIDLDVDVHAAKVSLDAAAFLRGIPHDSEAVATFSATCDPDSATAKYHRAAATLVVTIPTC